MDLLEMYRDVVAQLRELRAEVLTLKQRLDEKSTPSKGVSREEASTVGARFWMIVPQAKGPKQVFPVEVRPGSQDPDGDGNIAYRVVRTDQVVTQGGAVYRRPDELYRTREDADAAANPRRSGKREA